MDKYLMYKNNTLLYYFTIINPQPTTHNQYPSKHNNEHSNLDNLICWSPRGSLTTSQKQKQGIYKYVDRKDNYSFFTTNLL